MVKRSGKYDPLVEEYSRVAEHYDRKWSFYIEATTRETVTRLTLRPADRVLDVGCGTGALLRRLSETHSSANLAGVDMVAEMLAVARRRLPADVELREGRAERLPWGDATFDGVVSCNMFHYIRQPVAALREMLRVLRDDGRLVLTDWCDDFLACRVCDWYLRRFDRSHFKVYRRRECQDLLEGAGYRNSRVERYKINWLWGLMTATAVKAPA